MSFSNFIDNFYDGNYKSYMIVPLILFVIFVILAFVFPGVQPGVDLKGGNVVVLRSDSALPADELKIALENEFSLSDLTITQVSGPSGSGVILQFAHNKILYQASTVLSQAKSLAVSNPAESERLALQALTQVTPLVTLDPLSTANLSILDKAQLALDQAKAEFSTRLQNFIITRYNLPAATAFQVREVSPAVGSIFWQTSLQVSIFAVIFLSIVIFILFRAWFPVLAIIFGGLFDVIAALAFMAIFDIQLSLATISALLMLLGYSIDTEVLLNARVLKGIGSSFRKRAAGSMRTGLLMSFTAIGAVIVMVVFSYFNQMITVYEIAAVLLFGLMGDLIVTWLFNAPVILMHAERTHATKTQVGSRGVR